MKAIFFIGGIAAGKSYVANKYYKNIEIVDMDDFTIKLANGNPDKAKIFISQAIELAKEKSIKLIKSGNDCIVMATGSSFKNTYNKMKVLKDLGAEIHLVYVNTPVEKALKNQEKRVKDGNIRASTLPLFKIELSYKKSRNTFKEFKDNEILSSYKEIKN